MDRFICGPVCWAEFSPKTRNPGRGCLVRQLGNILKSANWVHEGMCKLLDAIWRFYQYCKEKEYCCFSKKVPRPLSYTCMRMHEVLHGSFYWTLYSYQVSASFLSPNPKENFDISSLCTPTCKLPIEEHCNSPIILGIKLIKNDEFGRTILPFFP